MLLVDLVNGVVVNALNSKLFLDKTTKLGVGDSELLVQLFVNNVLLQELLEAL